MVYVIKGNDKLSCILYRDMKAAAFFLFFLCLVRLSLQSNYTVVVVEYTPQLTTNQNIEKYESLIETAAKRYILHVIAFPEGTLTTNPLKACIVPHPDEKIIPYRNDTYKKYTAIRAMSAAAARHNIYVIVNLLERVYCNNNTNDCPDCGYFTYNTNVAFDRDGTVIARYRKYNLYEQNVDKPKTAELSTFTTDFNVTFGMIICFDILFKSPSIDLVKEKNVKNIIFSTFWFGELPFLTAVQMQVGWAYAMNVNLFASGANKPEIGSTGSGIYSREYKQSYMVEQDMDLLIIREFADVIDEKKLKMENRGLKLKEDISVRIATGKNLDFNNGKFNDKICYKDFCCRFDLKYRKKLIQIDENYAYRAVVFNDSKSFGIGGYHVQNYCAILLCTNGNCATKPSNGFYPLIFDEIRIDGDFERKNTFQMPNTLVWVGYKSNLKLLDTLQYEDYSFERKSMNGTDMDNVAIGLKKKGIDNVITFGIYGRKFN